MLYVGCIVTVCVLCLFLFVSWVGMPPVSVVFSSHTHFLMSILIVEVALLIMSHFS